MTDGLAAAIVDPAGSPADLESLLTELEQRHELLDSSFAAPHWRVSRPGWLRIVAREQQTPCGLLAGIPARGHISLLGATTARQRVGSLLISAFAQHAKTAGAQQLTVVLDSELRGRWDRRRFFEAVGFRAEPGSALHFTKDLTPNANDVIGSPAR